MLKGIFMDFYGTAVHENGPVAVEVVKRIYKSSTAESPDEVFRYWWKIFRQKLNEANGENFRTQHDVALENFKDLLEHFSSPEKPQMLLERMEEHWRTTAVYEDTKPFLAAMPIPVYFVTNSDDRYVSAAVVHAGLNPAGIITSEQARYSKPRKEIFLYALSKTGLQSNEVVHIGDSLISDVECPQSAGIRSIWLNREGKPVPDGVVSVQTLREAATLLYK